MLTRVPAAPVALSGSGLALLVLALLGAEAAPVHEAIDRVTERDVEQQDQNRQERRCGDRPLEDQDQQQEEDPGAEQRSHGGAGPGRRDVAPVALLARLTARSRAGLLTAPGATCPPA